MFLGVSNVHEPQLTLICTGFHENMDNIWYRYFFDRVLKQQLLDIKLAVVFQKKKFVPDFFPGTCIVVLINLNRRCYIQKGNLTIVSQRKLQFNFRRPGTLTSIACSQREPVSDALIVSCQYLLPRWFQTTIIICNWIQLDISC